MAIYGYNCLAGRCTALKIIRRSFVLPGSFLSVLAIVLLSSVGLWWQVRSSSTYFQDSK